MQFRLALEDGTDVDASGEGEALEFTLGDGTLYEHLEAHLLGLHAGDRERFLLGPEEAFGFRDSDNVHAMARGEFPPEMALEPGTVIQFDTPGGDAIPGTVFEVDNESVSIDFNHPLAGRNLIFEVEIISVS